MVSAKAVVDAAGMVVDAVILVWLNQDVVAAGCDFGGVFLLRGQDNFTASKGRWTGPCTSKSWVRTSFPQPGH